jgi:hypothetical protein
MQNESSAPNLPPLPQTLLHSRMSLLPIILSTAPLTYLVASYRPWLSLMVHEKQMRMRGVQGKILMHHAPSVWRGVWGELLPQCAHHLTVWIWEKFKASSYVVCSAPHISLEVACHLSDEGSFRCHRSMIYAWLLRFDAPSPLDYVYVKQDLLPFFHHVLICWPGPPSTLLYQPPPREATTLEWWMLLWWERLDGCHHPSIYINKTFHKHYKVALEMMNLPQIL